VRVAALGLGRATAGQAVSLAVPATGLANGIYLVKVRTDNMVLVQRLVIGR
jgi:hypothetical protein